MAVKTSSFLPKPAATETKAATKGAPENKAAAEPKYTVNDLMEVTGLVGASVRVALRSLNIDKSFGNKYGWATKVDFDDVVKQMKERSVKAPDALSKDAQAARAAAPKASVKAAPVAAAPAAAPNRSGKGKAS